MRKIINIGTIVIGHSITTTLLSQHNPDIIVVDEVHHINKDITEQLINSNKMKKRIIPISVSREELLLQSLKIEYLL